MVVQSKERPARVVTVGSKVLVAVCVEEKSKDVNGEVEQYFEFEQLEYDASYSEDVVEVMAGKYEKSAALAKAKELLDSTQFKFGDDYDQKGTPEWLELKAKRQEARTFIRANQ